MILLNYLYQILGNGASFMGLGKERRQALFFFASVIVKKGSVVGFHIFFSRSQSRIKYIYFCYSSCQRQGEHFPVKRKNNLFDCQCTQHASTNWGYYFYVPCKRRDCLLTWSSDPCEVIKSTVGSIDWANAAAVINVRKKVWDLLNVSACQLKPTTQCFLILNATTAWHEIHSYFY